VTDVWTEGVRRLTALQQPDGSFLSFSSSALAPHQADKTYATVFQNALILDCLCSLPSSAPVRRIKDTLAAFVLRQRSPHWSFNYWARTTNETQSLPYPDDLDDTFCALAALTRHDRTIIDGTALAHITTLLTLLEVEEGGPYHTWLVSADADPRWRGSDVAVNSNIAYFLSLHDIHLPKLTTFMESAIEDNAYTSPFYPSRYPLLYFISRWYKGTHQEKVRQALLASEKSEEKNPLYTALSLSALLRLGVAPEQLQEHAQRLHTMQQQGGWPAVSFCLDPALGGIKYYAGSQALTTAFCLEALTLYEQASSAPQATLVGASVPDAIAHSVYQSVEQQANNRLATLGPDLKHQAQLLLDQTLEYDKKYSLSLIPYFFLQALDVKTPIDRALLARAALISVYGWLAYSVYDNFWDEEGKPESLAVANIALRSLAETLPGVVGRPSDFPALAQQILDRMESANTWEMMHCRSFKPLIIPDFGDLSVLAERSQGHSLATIAVLCAQGHSTQSPTIQHVLRFFHHYLIARQLNDDMHDWEEDLERGQVNAVAALLLKQYQQHHGPLATVPDALTLRKFFWHEAVPSICDVVIHHVQRAERTARELPNIQDPAPLLTLLQPLAEAAQRTQAEQQQTVAFLRSYLDNEQPAI
jgi:hypothetical protein